MTIATVSLLAKLALKPAGTTLMSVGVSTGAFNCWVSMLTPVDMSLTHYRHVFDTTKCMSSHSADNVSQFMNVLNYNSGVLHL